MSEILGILAIIGMIYILEDKLSKAQSIQAHPMVTSMPLISQPRRVKK